MIDAETKPFGVIGYPVKHSLSPLLHNFSFSALKINAVYIALEVKPENFSEVINGIRHFFGGANITIPHKEMAYNIADFKDEFSQRSKASNTLKFQDGKIYAFNTDVWGFYKGLEFDIGRKIAIIGAGGVARAIITSIQYFFPGREIVVFNRTREKGEEIARDFQVEFKNIEDFQKYEFDTVINATSLGLQGENIFDFTGKPKAKNFFDTIYFNTKGLTLAKKMGLYAQNGLKMFIYQAIKSFEIWTGINPEKIMIRMGKKLRRIIRERRK